MSSTQVRTSRQDRPRKPADDAAHPDPRPGAVPASWRWRSATALRDATDFWSHR